MSNHQSTDSVAPIIVFAASVMTLLIGLLILAFAFFLGEATVAPLAVPVGIVSVALFFAASTTRYSLVL